MYIKKKQNIKENNKGLTLNITHTHKEAYTAEEIFTLPLTLLHPHTPRFWYQSNLKSILQAFVTLNSTITCLSESEAEGAAMEALRGFRGDAQSALGRRLWEVGLKGLPSMQ